MKPPTERAVSIPLREVVLEGTLSVRDGGHGVIVFANSSGSGRHSPRNRAVAAALATAAFATLLLDLLTADEEAIDHQTGRFTSDAGWLAERLIGATDWLTGHRAMSHVSVGYFMAGAGAGAALIAAAERTGVVKGVVACGGRPDLAGPMLARVQAPTLLIVGGNDRPTLELNRGAVTTLGARARLEILPGVTHLFEEAGVLEEVIQLAVEWFRRTAERESAA